MPLDHNLHFGIYQGLYAPHPDGGRVFERYPADYFDLVIIDECHRSGYGDWRAILDHVDSAFQLGMTATPKRNDSIDTYEFFASANRDGDGAAQPAFEYSLGRGIDDGYLATYRVHQVVTNIDKKGLYIEDEVDRGADLLVPEEAQLREIYVSTQFEREIVVLDRTRVLCEHLAGLLRTSGANEKTMIFCATMEHAAQVRDQLQNLLGTETGKDRYAVRIVSEEHDRTGPVRRTRGRAVTGARRRPHTRSGQCRHGGRRPGRRARASRSRIGRGSTSTSLTNHRTSAGAKAGEQLLWRCCTNAAQLARRGSSAPIAGARLAFVPTR